MRIASEPAAIQRTPTGQPIHDRKAVTLLDERSGGGRDAVLDGLRTIALTFVVLDHMIRYRFDELLGAQDSLLDRAIIPAAYSGISALFMISGYVITRMLWVERTKRGTVNVVAFIGRRALRIIPPFFILLATIATMSAVGYIDVPFREIAVSGAFLCNTGISQCSWFVGHTWTLGIEEQFYWLWPLIFLVTPRRHVDAVLIGVIATLLTIGVVRGGGEYNNEGPFLMVAVGALVATSEPLQRFLVRGVGGKLWFAAGVVLVVSSMITPLVVQFVLRPVLLAVLVFGVGNVRWIAAILRTAPFQIIGTCAYSLYLWQQVFLGSTSFYNGAPPPVWLLPVVVYLSYRFIEKPSIALGRSWTRAVSTPRATPVEAPAVVQPVAPQPLDHVRPEPAPADGQGQPTPAATAFQFGAHVPVDPRKEPATPRFTAE